MNQTFLPLYDIYQTAFLDLKGIPVKYERRGSRVIFLVPNEKKTHNFLAEYQSNPVCGLLEFASALRRVRAQMLAVRDDGKRQGENYEHNFNR